MVASQLQQVHTRRDARLRAAIKRAKARAEMEAAHAGRRAYLAEGNSSEHAVTLVVNVLDSDLRDISTEHATEPQPPAVIYTQAEEAGKTVVMFVSPDYFYSENETYAWVDVIRIGDLDAEGVTQSYTHNCWTTVLHHSCCPRPISIGV